MIRNLHNASQLENWSTKLLLMTFLVSSEILAQQPAPPNVDLLTFAAKRFPQPVRVGDLTNRTVLQPLESRPRLGHVKEVVRLSDGRLAIVMSYGGILGFGTHLIAVPIEAMVLLGNEVEVLDFSPDKLKVFPTFDGAEAVVLPPDEVIKMGLAHPSH